MWWGRSTRGRDRVADTTVRTGAGMTQEVACLQPLAFHLCAWRRPLSRNILPHSPPSRPPTLHKGSTMALNNASNAPDCTNTGMQALRRHASRSTCGTTWTAHTNQCRDGRGRNRSQAKVAPPAWLQCGPWVQRQAELHHFQANQSSTTAQAFQGTEEGAASNSPQGTLSAVDPLRRWQWL